MSFTCWRGWAAAFSLACGCLDGILWVFSPNILWVEQRSSSSLLVSLHSFVGLTPKISRDLGPTSVPWLLYPLLGSPVTQWSENKAFPFNKPWPVAGYPELQSSVFSNLLFRSPFLPSWEGTRFLSPNTCNPLTFMHLPGALAEGNYLWQT